MNSINNDNIIAGFYIMDHVLQNPENKMISLHQYVKELKTFNKNKNYTLWVNTFFNKLYISLMNFYKLGYIHGDIITEGNVYVIVNKQTEEIDSIKIIDYGKSIPIQNANMSQCKTISNVYKIVNEKYKRKKIRNNNNGSRSIMTGSFGIANHNSDGLFQCLYPLFPHTFFNNNRSNIL